MYGEQGKQGKQGKQMYIAVLIFSHVIVILFLS